MTRKVYLDSIGCRLNQAEIDAMERQFQALGYEVVQEAAAADTVVVNTCAVTRDAGKSSRKLIRAANRANPQAAIYATGCYTHIAPSQVGMLPGVAGIFDNSVKENLVATVAGEPFDLEPLQRQFVPGTGGNTRAYVKVQDGCDNRCTFCITQIARGAGRSRSMREVLREVQWMAAGGYQEVVLTGVNLGAYGEDFQDGTQLYELVRLLLTESDIPRLRLSSLEPWNLSEAFFRLWADYAPRLCRHLHLPLQSGCDATLRRMLRRTKQSTFAALVEAARSACPQIALSTDLIVGFPGETATEFEESYAFTAAMDFMKIHVFPFSARQGTAAARLKERTPPALIKSRLAAVQKLSKAGEERYYQQYMGQTVAVLWEGVRGASEEGFHHSGLTDNYLKVETTHPHILTNQVLTTRLTAYDGELAQGELLTEGAAHG